MDDIRRPSRAEKVTVTKRPLGGAQQSRTHVVRRIKVEPPKANLEDLFDAPQVAETPEDAEEQVNDFLDNAEDETKIAEDIDRFIDESKELDETNIPRKQSKIKADKVKTKKNAKKHHAFKIICRTICATILIAILVLGGLFFFKSDFIETALDQANSGSESLAADEIYYSPLSGLEVTKAQSEKNLTCVMIENSTDARPQSGLDSASIVYEALAEGGITRFMAVFQDNEPDYIGPVRSARLTYAQLSRQYNCTYVHAGGAGNALSYVRSSKNGIRNMEALQLESGTTESNTSSKYYFWRLKNRYAPHNLYTSFAKLDAYSVKKGWTSSNFEGFLRVDPDAVIAESTNAATTITVKFGGDSYNPVFTYNETTNTYDRAHKSGGAHYVVDRKGAKTQLSPDVVIAMKVKSVTRTSQSIYADYTTTGSGDAYVFQNGTVIAATWKRDALTSPLKFYDKSGSEIALNRGQTWISVYPSYGSVTWK